MTPSDIVFAVVQLVRLGQALEDFRKSQILEAEIKLVAESTETLKDDDYYFDAIQPERLSQLMLAVPTAAPFFGANAPPCPPDVRNQIVAFGRDVAMRRKRIDLELAGGEPRHFDIDKRTAIVIQAFRTDDPRPSPLHRLGLAVLRLSLETAAANPKIFRSSANGEKLITAVLTNVMDLLPDPENIKHWQVGFAERTAAILLTATARVVEQNAELIWDQARLQDFGKALIKPLRERLDKAARPGEAQAAYAIFRIENVRDELLAPMAHAALGVVAKNQQAFLGDGFNTDRVLGAVTEQFLAAALEDTNEHILRIFTKSGFIHFYDRMLGVIVERPELFIRGKSVSTELVRDIVSKCAAALKDAPKPYKREVAAEVAAAAIEAVAENLPALIKTDGDDWDKAGIAVLQSILTGFAAGVKEKDTEAFAKIFSREQAIEIVRVVAAQVALTPGMIVGGKANPEVARIAKEIAKLVAAPGANLLSPEHWTELIAALLKEAAANPGALFSLDDADRPDQKLASALLSDLFLVAAKAYEGGRKPGVLLFGQTLAEAAATVARAAVRNAAKAVTEAGQAAAKRLAERLTKLAADNPGQVSDHDWRFLYANWISYVIEHGELPVWEDADLIKMLYIENHREPAEEPAGENGGQS